MPSQNDAKLWCVNTYSVVRDILLCRIKCPGIGSVQCTRGLATIFHRTIKKWGCRNGLRKGSKRVPVDSHVRPMHASSGPFPLCDFSPDLLRACSTHVFP